MLPGSGAPEKVTFHQTCSHASKISCKLTEPQTWIQGLNDHRGRDELVLTGHRAVEVGGAARHLLQRLPALVSVQTYRGGEGGGVRGEEVCLVRGLMFYCTATTAHEKSDGDNVKHVKETDLMTDLCL